MCYCVTEDRQFPNGNFRYGIRWNVGEISGVDYANGMILQNIIRLDYDTMRDEESENYWEAWLAIDGVIYDSTCLKGESGWKFIDIPSKEGETHDLWELDRHNKIQPESGYTKINADVYWLECGSAAYDEVFRWCRSTRDGLTSAANLRHSRQKPNAGLGRPIKRKEYLYEW